SLCKTNSVASKRLRLAEDRRRHSPHTGGYPADAPEHRRQHEIVPSRCSGSRRNLCSGEYSVSIAASPAQSVLLTSLPNNFLPVSSGRSISALLLRLVTWRRVMDSLVTNSAETQRLLQLIRAGQVGRAPDDCGQIRRQLGPEAPINNLQQRLRLTLDFPLGLALGFALFESNPLNTADVRHLLLLPPSGAILGEAALLILSANPSSNRSSQTPSQSAPA